MKATIASLIFLLLSLAVSSQTYKYIGIEEGLSNQKIYRIQKDARGYMWFLTHVGIDRYNGKEIKYILCLLCLYKKNGQEYKYGNK